MKSTCNCEAGPSLGLLFARLPLGLSLAHTGFKKIHDMGVENFVSASSDKYSELLPPSREPVPACRAVRRGGTGALLVLGLLSRVSGLLTALMLVSFAMAESGFVN